MSSVDPATQAGVPVPERHAQRRPEGGRDFNEAVRDARPEGHPVSRTPPEQDPGAAKNAVGRSATDGAPVAGAVLYPWQLQAQAGISQLPVTAYSALGAPAQGEGDLGASPPMTLTSTPSASVLEAAHAVWRSLDDRVSAQAVAASLGRVELERTQRSPSADGRQSLAALTPWAERLQRRLEDAQGRATVWIRDYQMDPATSVASIEDILAFYGPDRPVWRIVVNGSEVWRRPPLDSQET